MHDLKLCFACLKPIGKDHIARNCTQRKKCDTCGGSHPSTLHDIKRISSNAIRKESITEVISLCVVPVYVSHQSNPNKVTLCYAMLVNDGTGCFRERSLLESLAPDHLRKATVSVETINVIKKENTTTLDGLIVRCADGHQRLYSSEDILLPSSSTIPISENEIPTPANTGHWEHLSVIKDSIPEFNKKIPFGLIIGGNCPKALARTFRCYP